MFGLRSNPWYSRGHLVYLFALPLLPGVFAALENGQSTRAGLYAAALALFVAASGLIRFGLKAQHSHSASRFANHFTHRLTWAGASLVGAACFLTQWALAGHSLAAAGTMALAGFTGAYLCYGAPALQRVTRGADGYSADEIADLLRKGENEIDAIEEAARHIDDRNARLHLLRVVVKSHRVLNEIHEDPADLRRARRFFSVFLPGMRSVSESYLKAGNTSRSGNIDLRFKKILFKMEHLVDRQHAALQRADELDHDVKLEVLQTQIEESWGKRKAG